MNIENRIVLDKFVARPYQKEIIDALEKGYKKLVIVLPRRAGKDITCWNVAIRQCIAKVCLVQYILPTFGQARRCIFQAIDSDGNKFTDYIPAGLIDKVNSSEQKIIFKNGSILQCLGGDTHDTSIRGTNPYMVILSEFAYMQQDVYNTVRPILAANGGTVIFLSTPYGKNHFYHLFQVAKELPDWFVLHKKTSDIMHISEDALRQEREQMSAELFEQEYECNFNRGVDGSYFGKNLQDLKQKGQITHVAWEPGLLVHVAMDIGVKDATTLIWFQVVGDGTVIRIIDCYSNTGMGLDHYAHVLQSKPYRYGKYFAPHDLAVREWGGGAITRYEKARQLDINFTILDQISVADGIENVWTHFPKFWIDAENCKSLLDAMENYRREFDEKNNVYRNKPLHNWASNYCFTADTLILTRNGMRPIIEITQNDFVLTLEGWKPCSQSIITRKDAQLVAVQFTDGTIVRCTPDHMFLTENGWISAELLTKNTRIQSSLMKSHNTSMDLYIEYGPALNTSLREEDCFIDMFGVAHLAKYHQTTTFITKIKTLKTIIYTILNACIRTSISIYQKVVTEYLVNSAETRLRYGMHLPREYCGIRDKQSDVGLGKNGKERKENVYIASNYLTASLDQMGINRSFAQIIAKPLIIESVKKLKSNEDVYCINVPIVGHFSLSNGAIVKNCDALRYLCQSLHKTKKGLTTEEFERKRAEAMYGPGRFKQKIFNHDPRFDR